jgi:penicillin-binding protein 1C
MIRSVATYLYKLGWRLGKWLLLSLAALVLFVLLMNRFYPLTLTPAQQTSRTIVDHQGQWLYTTTNPTEKWRFPVEIHRLDPLYLQMLLRFEDRRFWGHYGLDPLAMGRAIWQLIKQGRITSGGSTITMQLARLLEPKPRTVRSKIIEIIRAFQLESTYSKEEILQAYLTLAPYGGNVEGIIGASMRYFGKLPYALSISEAATLVSLPQSPEHNRPDRYPEQSRIARDKVLKIAKEAGILTPLLYTKATDAPVTAQRFSFPRYAPHLSQRLLHRSEKITIQTTLDATLQQQLEQWAAQQGSSLPKGTTLASLIIQNRTASVLAYLGSHDMFSPKVAGFVDIIPVPRSPGSLLKPFIYGLGFEKHLIHPNTLIMDRETRFGDYLPHNYSREYTGEVTVAYALQHSLNIPAVKVLQKLGAQTFIERITALTGKIEIPKKQATLPIALGGMGVSLWQVAQLYTALANEGRAPKLHYLSEEADHTASLPILRPQAAQMTTAILRAVTPPKGHRNSAYKIAYKTGTSYGYRDLWTAAYTPEYTVIVWVGRPNNAPQLKRSGREVAAPMAFEIMEMIEALHPMKNWQWDSHYLGNQVPKGLKYFDTQTRKSDAPLQLLYPKEGTRYRSAGCHDVIVEVSLIQGKPPYYWYIDGVPTEITNPRTDLPFGRGAHTITIIDATGDTITRDIWVDMPECQK